VLSKTDPDTPADTVFAVFTTIEPELELLLPPLLTDTLPPTAADRSVPALNTRLPPALLDPVPTTKLMEPLYPAVAKPVASRRLPEFPTAVVPDWTNNAPDAPADAAFPDCKTTAPEAPLEPAPLRMETAPPEAPEDVAAPAWMSNTPPVLLLPDPTTKEMAPPRPLVGFPEVSTTYPELPLKLLPVLNVIAPDTPAEPTFGVDKITEPEPELALAPLVTASWPPSPDLLRPATNDSLGVEKLIDPATPVAEAPVPRRM